MPVMQPAPRGAARAKPGQCRGGDTKGIDYEHARAALTPPAAWARL